MEAERGAGSGGSGESSSLSPPTLNKKAKLVSRGKELKEQMLRKFSEEETEYEEQVSDNQKMERVRGAMMRLESYENVRGAVDEISESIMERLEYLQKVRAVM